MTKEQLADILESNLPEKDEGGGSVVSNELIREVVEALRK